MAFRLSWLFFIQDSSKNQPSTLKIGPAKSAVAMPTRAIAKLPIATCRLLLEMQVLTPRAWLEAPIARPMEISFLTPHKARILWPHIAPKIPVKITQAAVSGGIPPRPADMSMAIGVVTDLGIREMMMVSEAPKNLAHRIIEITPDKVPTRAPLSSIL